MSFNIEGPLTTTAPDQMTSEEVKAHVVLHLGVLEGLKSRYDKQFAESQEILRVYVTDKSIPLDARFKIWSKWCKKIIHPWVINEEKVPFFGQVVKDDRECFERYGNYDWDYFLNIFYGTYNELQKKYGVATEDDVKEALIETNFGSFHMDW